ncbi:MAG: FAD:protein transferase, partial [Actinomycetota bacterium]|nr:FAD:protein transferase [Actinomycetota bacterium]
MVARLVHVEHVMGTVVSFDIRLDDESRRAAMSAAVAEAVTWLHRVDAVFSTYRADSQISRLSRAEIALDECDADVADVLALCARVGTASRGYFSSTYAGHLDPTGVVKGWSVQRASELLSAAGSRNHSVNGGGDLQLVGEPEPGRCWQVGIAHPLHRNM